MRTRRAATAGLLAGLLLPTPTGAHQGPPFPLLVDRPVGPYTVSVWSDPDIGVGTFYVILEGAGNGEAIPPGVTVEVAVRPVSGRLEERSYRAERQPGDRRVTFTAKVDFDRGELWDVRVDIEGPDGGGSLASQVEATPDGMIGPIGLVLYALPFLAVGFLWVRAVMVRRGLAGPAARSAKGAASGETT